ncbi:HNH endonuclease signature motif containing protein [Nocardioides sp. J54]|uniref:HNH endonuclease signature motif containing protein n=1 Tax=Nocardioides sp. J54 TaxID=935866 RepID=UPI00048DC6BB|nr:HNH endonuclease signature motif containing protein [Nocardioides sp. J54]
MDLGTNTSIGQYDGRSVPELLGEIRSRVDARKNLWIDEWIAIVAWADQNVIDSPEGAATLLDGVVDTGVPIAGPGAPLVSEFALMELIAVLGRSPIGGHAYVGQVIECAWRLPRLYRAVVAGRVHTWKAQRIADLTHPLSPEAAEFVDRQLDAAIEDVGWKQLERLVTEAVLRFDPERAAAERERISDHRHFDIDEPSDTGHVIVHGLMDAADGHDLDEAISRRAILLGKCGDDSSMDVRRSKAAAELARQDLSLDLLFADPDTGEVLATAPGRRVTLNVHVTDTTLTGDNLVARCEETGTPVLATQVKEWLQAPRTTVIVRPVIDLADCVPVDSYEIPDRHRQRVQLRDHACRFPGCTVKATRCDLDHTIEHNRGGPTCPCNLVPLCRRHHRAKTFSLWRYVTVQPGHYLWMSPNGRHFLVSLKGTRVLDTPRRLHPDDY